MKPSLNRNEPSRARNLFVFMILVGTILLLVLIHSQQSEQHRITLSIGEFWQRLASGSIRSFHLKGQQAQGRLLVNGLRTPQYFRVTFPEHYLIMGKRYDAQAGQEVTNFDYILTRVGPRHVSYSRPNTFIYNLFLAPLPWLLLFLIVWIVILRQMRSPGNDGGVFSFGRSRARLTPADQMPVTFADVAGIEEAKEEVQEIVAFLKAPDKFQRIGGRVPHGILLVGPPGAGKTLLARAIAGEAGVPFFSICGSDFVEMFVGVGAARVRDLFRQAKAKAPCIIFLDEIDAVGRRRGTGLGGGHDEREQTLNAILVEMDGFERHQQIIMIAATNRPDVLDPALLRPGRFDREIVIDLPDLRGREEILKIHVQKVKLAPQVDLHLVARGTPGFSGADLEALINEAAILAVMRGKQWIETAELEECRDKIKWGRQKRSKVMSAQDRRITAYHESGHALVALQLPAAEPLHKVSIIPRGMALGMTMQLPREDRYHIRRNYLRDQITVMYGGRVAEELCCGDISAGAQDDLRQATAWARSMVCKWGMSATIGPISYEETEEHLFLGREVTRTKRHSEATLQQIDHEVQQILQECYQRCRQIITEQQAALERVAEALLEHEVLTVEQVQAVLAGKEPGDQQSESLPFSHNDDNQPTGEDSGDRQNESPT